MEDSVAVPFWEVRSLSSFASQVAYARLFLAKNLGFESHRTVLLCTPLDSGVLKIQTWGVSFTATDRHIPKGPWDATLGLLGAHVDLHLGPPEAHRRAS